MVTAMHSDYGFTSYKVDVEAAHDAYTATIKRHCMIGGTVVPLNSAEIYRAKAEAQAIKNQLISAAGKRLRASIAIRMLDHLKAETDMTFTLALHVTKLLLGRAINRQVLLSRYATQGRTAAEKSRDLHRLPVIAESKTFISYKNELEEALHEAAAIREEVRCRKMKGKEARDMLSKSSKAHHRENF